MQPLFTHARYSKIPIPFISPYLAAATTPRSGTTYRRAFSQHDPIWVVLASILYSAFHQRSSPMGRQLLIFLFLTTYEESRTSSTRNDGPRMHQAGDSAFGAYISTFTYIHCARTNNHFYFLASASLALLPRLRANTTHTADRQRWERLHTARFQTIGQIHELASLERSSSGMGKSLFHLPTSVDVTASPQ